MLSSRASFETLSGRRDDSPANVSRIPTLPPLEAQSITGLVLAGGRASRMGGLDKGLQTFDGTPLIARVLQRLAPQVGPLLINANRNLDRHAAFGCRVVTDGWTDFQGPLAGLHAGLMACTTDYLVAVPCDAPFLSRALVAGLWSAFADDACDLAVASAAGRLHPVFCLMRTSLVGDLADFIERGGRAVGAWVEHRHGRAVSFDDEASFRNLNTVADLREAERDGLHGD